MRQEIRDWHIDYGDGRGSKAITLPHAWRQDVPVSWEGPAIYRTSLLVPDETCWLTFEGVSYYARVFLNGQLAGEHRGIWTAFSISLAGFEGKEVQIKVEVTKNGGRTFPVDQVASGFLPFVFYTFGGIYREVFLTSAPFRSLPAKDKRVSVKGRKIYVDDKPFYARGILTWGWYPKVGHPNPSEGEIESEVRSIKKQGFNLVKFCLWVPSHRYLEVLDRHGMFAWMELPIWDPSLDHAHQEQIFYEVREIVDQYRHHSNIVYWTCGCELNAKVTADYKRRLYEMVKELTGSPLVKDNSGGSEMYGGDPREFGDFFDFHPYCDTHFYPQVLDSLLPGTRANLPLLLGEFNDCDIHRPLPAMVKHPSYWASVDPKLNDQGVRWQYDLPKVLATSPIANDECRSADLEKSSRDKSRFVRKFVQEQVRAREDISGYVITSLSETPISSSIMVESTFEMGKPHEPEPWNMRSCLFLIPDRRPPWIAGGNRPGWKSTYCHFVGDLHWKIGVHSEKGLKGTLRWILSTFDDRQVVRFGTGMRLEVGALSAREVGEIFTQVREPGWYVLRCFFGDVINEWPIYVTMKPSDEDFIGWGKHDPAGLFDDLHLASNNGLICSSLPSDFSKVSGSGKDVLLFLREEGTVAMPFWRESAYEFHNDAFWSGLGWRNRWEPFLDVAPDRALDPSWIASLDNDVEVMMNRVDVRTYAEHPVMIRAGKVIATTLRPFGGLGIQPYGVTRNAAGAHLLKHLISFQNHSAPADGETKRQRYSPACQE